jgi:rhamnosyltransferase
MLLSILVLHNQRLEKSKTFSSLFAAAPIWDDDVHLLIYDNSPVPMHAADEFGSPGSHIHYISDTSNPGVSRAYNRGVQLARELRDPYLLLLDQDTIFPQDAISCYLRTIESNKDSPLFVPILLVGDKIYSPCRDILHVNLPLHAVQPGVLSAKQKSAMNSGMCIRVDAFEKIGGFDEKIPLDFADHDFMRRYRKRFDSLMVIDMVCVHSFSENEPMTFAKALARFDFYCRGARNSVKGVWDASSFLPLTFLRAVRLSVRYRRASFLVMFFRSLFKD